VDRRRTRLLLAAASAVAAAGAGCSLLVTFRDQPVCDGGKCGDASPLDASADGRDEAPPADAPRDVADAAPDPCAQRPDGTICAYLGGCNCTACKGGTCSDTKKCPEGYNWEAGDDLARCCGGLAVRTNTNANCGVCGIVCKTAGVSTPQDCQPLAGHYLCLGCSTNPECWSQCCSTSPAPNHCAASDCNMGTCPDGICPAPAHCVVGTGNSPNYCSY
jgi:hypothetical protein